ncbi:hypothetical protein Hanom_Chr10g00947111 [Helianthus anomalus]
MFLAVVERRRRWWWLRRGWVLGVGARVCGGAWLRSRRQGAVVLDSGYGLWWWTVEEVVADGCGECSVCLCCEVVIIEVKKTNPLLLTDCRPLVHLFSCRCLQMWSADCRPFASEKTNTILVKL